MARLIVTGVGGCLGAWVARHLIQDRHQVVGLDVSLDTHRLRLLGIEGVCAVQQVDVRDHGALQAVVERERPDALIHLAALQIPGCRANPMRCAEINVGGTMNLLELARAGNIPLIYASSAAVYGPDPSRMLGEEEGVAPQNLYGVFKRANEDMARIYAAEFGVRSIGFRPYVVYGPGRDLGVTSDITTALQHASRGEPFRIRFGGRIALQHASDVARAFIAAALRPGDGARVYNLRGTVSPVAEVVAAIDRATGTAGLVTHDETPLPIAPDLSDQAFQADLGPFAYVDLDAGFRQTLEVWASVS